MKRCAALITLVLVLLAGIPAARAGEAWYLMTQFDQDALILGRVREASAQALVLEVVRVVAAAEGLSTSATEQLAAGSVRILSPGDYSFFGGQEGPLEGGVPAKGDAVLASVSADNRDFAVKHGLYKVDSADYNTLRVLFAREHSNSSTERAAATIACFVNSDGQVNRFVDEGTTTYALVGEERVAIYDLHPRQSPAVATPAPKAKLQGERPILIAATPGPPPVQVNPLNYLGPILGMSLVAMAGCALLLAGRAHVGQG